MKKAAEGAVLAVVSLIAVIVVGVGSIVTAAFASGATALIVPGTGTPKPNSYPEYVRDARDYYLRDTACGAPHACLAPGRDLIGIDYPASFWPLTFIPGWCTVNCQKWDVSVAEGVDNLETAVAAALADPRQEVVVYGHSQGAAVVSNTLRRLGTTLNDAEKDRVRVVVTGNVDNPAGGMWSRIGFLGRIPVVDLTVGLPTPTDTGITFTSIAMQYDGASNAPKYWGNVLSLANAVAGFAYLHGTTLIPDERTPQGVPDYYPSVEEYLAAVYDPANAKQDSHGNTYIVVPSPILPIMMPILDLAARTETIALVKPLVDLVSPVLRVLIDLGYDPDEQPGVYSPLSVLPFSPNIDFVKVAGDLVEAAGQGIHDAVHGGAPLPVPPTVALSAAPPAASPAADSESAEVESSLSLNSNMTETSRRDDLTEPGEEIPALDEPTPMKSTSTGQENPVQEVVSEPTEGGEDSGSVTIEQDENDDEPAAGQDDPSTTVGRELDDGRDTADNDTADNNTADDNTVNNDTADDNDTAAAA